MSESQPSIRTVVGFFEIFVGVLLVGYGVWTSADVSLHPPDHVSPVWGHALAVSYALVGVFGFAFPGILLIRGPAWAWYLQVLVPLGLLAREPATIAAVVGLRWAGLV